MLRNFTGIASVLALTLTAACVSESSGGSSGPVTPAASGGGLPTLNATCPLGISVHADEHGPVFINGQQAELNKFNDSFYEAKKGDVTVSIAINPDSTTSISYNKRGSGNGICTVSG